MITGESCSGCNGLHVFTARTPIDKICTDGCHHASDCPCDADNHPPSEHKPMSDKELEVFLWN